ncbi:MAG: hypothetical protein LBO70_02570 [Clostridiales Family XIII bacterium]|nr:hypothetical protein [Clostridiales Family XIII bacterium]
MKTIVIALLCIAMMLSSAFSVFADGSSESRKDVTSFADSQGQYGNNKKGSVATKLAYDNCGKNTPIDLTMKKKSGGNSYRSTFSIKDVTYTHS